MLNSNFKFSMILSAVVAFGVTGIFVEVKSDDLRQKYFTRRADYRCLKKLYRDCGLSQSASYEKSLEVLKLADEFLQKEELSLFNRATEQMLDNILLTSHPCQEHFSVDWMVNVKFVAKEVLSKAKSTKIDGMRLKKRCLSFVLMRISEECKRIAKFRKRSLKGKYKRKKAKRINLKMDIREGYLLDLEDLDLSETEEEIKGRELEGYSRFLESVEVDYVEVDQDEVDRYFLQEKFDKTKDELDDLEKRFAELRSGADCLEDDLCDDDDKVDEDDWLELNKELDTFLDNSGDADDERDDE